MMDLLEVVSALEGHEGVIWVRAQGGWTCRCGEALTDSGWAADALELWRAHMAQLLVSP